MGNLGEKMRPMTCGRIGGRRSIDSRVTILAMALLSVAEAVARYPLSAGRVRSLVAAGTVRGVKFGNSWTVDDESLRAYLATERKRGPKPKARD